MATETASTNGDEIKNASVTPNGIPEQEVKQFPLLMN
jgi:hypothetical protein